MTGALAAIAAAALLWPATARHRLGRPPRRLRFGAPAVAVIAAAVVVGATLVLAIPTVAAIALATGTAVLRWQRRRRRAADRAGGQALAAALDIVVGELRIGVTPVAAFSAAAEAASAPAVASGLGTVAARASLGADVAAGLRAATGSAVLAAYWERLAVCWQLAARHGLPVAALMRAAQRDIVEHQQFTARVSAALAGTRATAMILAGLPVLGLALGQLIGAAPLRVLTDPAGAVLMFIGVTLACVGLLWSDRIVSGVTG